MAAAPSVTMVLTQGACSASVLQRPPAVDSASATVALYVSHLFPLARTPTMASFLGQQLNLKPAAAGAVRRSAQPVVAATKPKVAPAKKGAKPVAASKAKNRWLNADDGYDSSKWYGPDRKLFLPGGLLDPSEVPDYLDGSLPGEYVPRYCRHCMSQHSLHPWLAATATTRWASPPRVARTTLRSIAHTSLSTPAGLCSAPWARSCRRHSMPTARTSRAQSGGRCAGHECRYRSLG